MTRSRVVAAVSAVAVAAVPAVALAGTSHTQLFQNPKKSAVCGLEIHAAGKPATFVLCSATGLPKPKHGWVIRSSRSVPLGFATDRGDQPGVVGQPTSVKTLSSGTLWSSIGVTCNVAKGTVLCFNGDNHGFVIGNGKYKSF